MPKHFVFLEILDPEINALLTRLREEFGGGKSKTNIHLTVRGPYTRPVAPKMFERYSRLIEADDVLISGVGMFDNIGSYVVYVGVHNSKLRRMWYKPDYPVKTFGFNPHISLYRGHDERLAKCIFHFLKAERIELICRHFRLTSYVTDQLFANQPALMEKQFLELVNRGKVRFDVLQRAANMVRLCKQSG